MGFTSIPIRNIIHEAVARGGIIVDVRSREEFASGHIPMAINGTAGTDRGGGLFTSKE